MTFASQNIQLTSDKAFRSGDAKTIAMLVESQHKSLQLMASHSSQLEAIARRGEEGRKSLTCHVHARLKLVMQLQKTVADSNGQLVLLHEHIKLACRRFEILEQVCSTPQVLVEVSSEVGRRRSYNVALEKVCSPPSLLLFLRPGWRLADCVCVSAGDGRDCLSAAQSTGGGEEAEEVLPVQSWSALCHVSLPRAPG